MVEGRVDGTEGGAFRPGVLLGAEGGMSGMVASEVGRARATPAWYAPAEMHHR